MGQRSTRASRLAPSSAAPHPTSTHKRPPGKSPPYLQVTLWAQQHPGFQAGAVHVSVVARLLRVLAGDVKAQPVAVAVGPFLHHKGVEVNMWAGMYEGWICREHCKEQHAAIHAGNPHRPRQALFSSFHC